MSRACGAERANRLSLLTTTVSPARHAAKSLTKARSVTIAASQAAIGVAAWTGRWRQPRRDGPRSLVRTATDRSGPPVIADNQRGFVVHLPGKSS